YLLPVFLSLGLLLSAQQPVKLSKNIKNIAVPAKSSVREGVINPLNQTANQYVHSAKSLTDMEIGSTYYDLQSNTSAPANRFYRYDDGNMGAVWTRGMNTSGYADRGTGYNFFSGADWLPAPSARIETVRTGWPTYAAMGTGEIVIAHHDVQGLVVNRRDTRGTGTWAQSILPGPAGAVDISWPRMVSSGADHMNIHLLAMTYSAYQNLDLALLYYRSTDGGATWDIQHQIIPGMGSDENVGFSGDTYSWAEPKGDNLAFVVGDNWNDLFVMKSTDNGETWEKTIIWKHPYPMWDKNNPTPTDTFYCPDGAAHAAFDANGKLHVVFGVNRAMFAAGATDPSWFPWVDGLAYWNEDMPTWSDGDVDALNPDNLYASGNLIGWMQDVNQNGTLDLIGFEVANMGLYYVGPSSMPQITIDDNNYIYVVYSGITEGFDNGSQQYRHIWARGSGDNGTTWGDFVDLDGDIIHLLDECVFPTIANTTSPERVHLIYQADNEPGLSVRGDEDSPSQNIIYYTEFDKTDVVNVGVNDVELQKFTVSQNYPNPTNGTSQVMVNLNKTSNVGLQVFDITGRKVYEIPVSSVPQGSNILNINANYLTRGIYTYTVSVNGTRITHKMVIE
ncbi:MAG: T9SS type A sorting domain-containing protein, partial [Omnitrophica WOR_2 bacterium]